MSPKDNEHCQAAIDEYVSTLNGAWSLEDVIADISVSGRSDLAEALRGRYLAGSKA